MSELPEDNLELFNKDIHPWPLGPGFDDPRRAAENLRNAAAELRRSGSKARREGGKWLADKVLPGDALWNEDLKNELRSLKRSLSQSASRSDNNQTLNNELANACTALSYRFDEIANENDERPKRKNLF